MADQSTKQSWVRKQGVLLLLLATCLLTATLVVEQQQIIESQRILIRDLFRDSMELSQMKIKNAAVKH